MVPDLANFNPNETLSGQTVDLFEEDESLYVTECDGQDVDQLNFSKPQIMQDHTQGLILKRRGRVGLL